MKRKLASIQKVNNIAPHPNADKLEIATVLGWQVIVKKGEFKVGDIGVYCETDSLMPAIPQFDFLKHHNYRIKISRLRGCISQGILFPITILPETHRNEVIGTDVTAVLGITKYENIVPLMMNGEEADPFPGFIFKTDKLRLQSYPDLLQRNKGKYFSLSEKIDGTSATYYWHEGKFGVCSKELDIRESAKNLYWWIAQKYDIKAKLKELGNSVAIQGEIWGATVQGNYLEAKERKFSVYDIFNIQTSKYTAHSHLYKICHDLKLDTVPFLKVITLNQTLEELVNMANISSTINPNKLAEGIVFTALEEDTDIELGRLGFKVINPVYELQLK